MQTPKSIPVSFVDADGEFKQKYHREMFIGLSKAEAESLANSLNAPQEPPHPGPWHLLGVKSLTADFGDLDPNDMYHARKLAEAGKVRLIGRKWFRLFKVIATWQHDASKAQPETPPGEVQAPSVALEPVPVELCPAGLHKMTPDNLLPSGLKEGRRRCRTCFNLAAKARRKRGSLSHKAILVRESSR